MYQYKFSFCPPGPSAATCSLKPLYTWPNDNVTLVPQNIFLCHFSSLIRVWSYEVWHFHVTYSNLYKVFYVFRYTNSTIDAPSANDLIYSFSQMIAIPEIVFFGVLARRQPWNAGWCPISPCNTAWITRVFKTWSNNLKIIDLIMVNAIFFVIELEFVTIIGWIYDSIIAKHMTLTKYKFWVFQGWCQILKHGG